jgi:hypothetical protein
MPGWGYRMTRPQVQAPSQRVGTLIGDLQERISRIEQTRPGFSVGDVDPSAPAQLGFMHLNRLERRVWVYTERGWITADSNTKLNYSTSAFNHTSTSYVNNLTVDFKVPPSGGFVHVYAEVEISRDAAGPLFEAGLADDVEFSLTRVVQATPPTGTYGVATTATGSTVGGAAGMGGWLTYWTATPGWRTMRLAGRSTTGALVRTRNRGLYVVVF